MNTPLNINKPVGSKRKLTITYQVTDRDKILLAVFGVILLVILSYFVAYKPIAANTEVLKNEKEKVSAKVAEAVINLANEQSIIQSYNSELAKGNEISKSFFPEVYPYKDRYVQLLAKAVQGTGATTMRLDFSDPEVGGVTIPEDNRLLLPGYPLQSLAEKINAANNSGNLEDNVKPDTEEPGNKTPDSQKKTKKSDQKKIPADALLRLPVTLEVQGTYPQIRTVIRNLEKLDRTIAMEVVTVRKQEASLNASITMSFYVLDKVDNGADPFNSWTIKGTYGKGDLFN